MSSSPIQYRRLYSTSLLGQLHEFFVSRFFLSINPTYCPDTRAKAVRRKQSTIFEFGWVIDPAETVTAGSLTPLKLFPRGHLPRWNDFSGVIDPAEMKLPEFFWLNLSYEITKLWNNSKISCEISAGSLTPLKQFQRVHWPRRNNFSEVIDPSWVINPPKRF
jgi:hypothetical protein